MHPALVGCSMPMGRTPAARQAFLNGLRDLAQAESRAWCWLIIRRWKCGFFSLDDGIQISPYSDDKLDTGLAAFSRKGTPVRARNRAHQRKLTAKVV
jgi:hypothetical protein